MNKNLPPLQSSSKTFVLDSCDENIGIILKENGWKQTSKISSTWNLKWTWKSNPKQTSMLQQNQLLNHFNGSEQLTTKLGLNLLYKKNPFILDSGKSFAHFYPRSYNMSCEKQQFVKDFLNTGILNLLKKIAVTLQLYFEDQYKIVLKYKNYHPIQNSTQFLKSLLTKQKLYQKPTWNILQLNGKLLMRLIFYIQNLFSLQQAYQFSKEQLLQLCQYSQKFDTHEYESNSKILQCPSIQLLSLIMYYYEKCLKQINCFQQDGFSNIWVVKSNHSSRGRNITLISNLKQIQSLDNGMKLVQKYIQNIWVLQNLSDKQKTKYKNIHKIHKRKFDIRFWVLVKSFTPFCAYIYDEAYLRISEQKYRLDCIQIKTAHLTNYSVNWKHKKKLASDDQSCSYLLFNEYLHFLNEEMNSDTQAIKQKIYQAIKQTLKLVDIKENKQCFQLFGFDIILDAQLNPWVLQCNMSPACSPRGQLINIIKEMSKGMLSLIGCIDGDYYGWKPLISENEKIDNKKKSKSHRILKQLKLQSNRSKNSVIIPINKSDFNIYVSKLDWNFYRECQKFHYFIQKVKIIQQFYKSKKNQFKNGKSKNKKIAKQNDLIEVLAKIVCSHEKNLFQYFIKSLRSYQN